MNSLKGGNYGCKSKREERILCDVGVLDRCVLNNVIGNSKTQAKPLTLSRLCVV